MRAFFLFLQCPFLLRKQKPNRSSNKIRWITQTLISKEPPHWVCFGKDHKGPPGLACYKSSHLRRLQSCDPIGKKISDTRLERATLWLEVIRAIQLRQLGIFDLKNLLARPGFDPGTFGLWAQHAASAPSRFSSYPDSNRGFRIQSPEW